MATAKGTDETKISTARAFGTRIPPMQNFRGTFLVVATVVALAIVFFIYINILGGRFTAAVEADLRGFFDAAGQSPATPRAVSKADWQNLPAPAQKYFSRVLKEGTPYATAARMRMVGEYLPAPRQTPLAFGAEEYFDGVTPGFIWFAKIKLNKHLWNASMERYQRGEGRYSISLLGAFNKADGHFAPDPSSLARYLAEAVWFPTALLPGGAVRWEAVDDSRARAVITDGAQTASALFTFDGEGLAVSATSQDRIPPENPNRRKMKWTLRYADYRDFGGMKIPCDIRGEWDVIGKPFEYTRFTLSDVEFNRAGRLPPPAAKERSDRFID